MEDKKLREELTTKFIELGQLAHQLARNNSIQDQQVIKISDEICLIDKRIHEASGKYVPSKEEMRCPSCMTSYEDGAVFCGNCGQNIKEFYESTIENCKTCNSIVKKDSNYCGVCGSRLNI
ncbi:Double zinc ribbon [Proteiniborus ethanoligenes]|uniref:Double zinc ribbon n=1 Tax=Proteiniborus ethanoligenes TaxID=415015 RepID=A0A1H3RBB0_9FIRM|nr:zinc ribbon domain-containing protein [Proteiniborus ethanoligenes]SDZ22926.1 Double zinc ribbon [Proteiniborus ethanoligenes]